ncbi:sulfoxide reductase heme-binding subunit YedZ [Roseomonas arctica]|uniref:Protein-methionine-sulfoxide reductase heme-binding subunit MsrQ n=2 Tax=Plastoroseomonas arctica TaxID=1509237 RepID=A0AAF1K4V5_9PROT|nr:sulfoxide reductase heme-binding subunit YedZ [Plastoroseomonas arctica]
MSESMGATLRAITPWTDRNGGFSPLRLIVFLALLVPAGSLAWLAYTQDLGPEPLRGAMHESGRYAIWVLLVSLFVTPLRQMLRWPRLVELRRMVGLFALSYALLHLVLYFAFQNWRLLHGVSEIVLRFYLTVGFVAVLGLVALGVTSTDGWVHRMGGRAWRRLHKVVFAVAVLGLLHFMLHTKSDITEPVLTMGLFVWLMLYRAVAPEGSAPSSLRLLGVAVAAAVVTGASEAAWYALKTGVNAVLVLEANLDWEFGLRPALWVLVAGLGVIALREVARLVPRGGRARRARAA